MREEDYPDVQSSSQRDTIMTATEPTRMQAAARALGLQVHVLEASTDRVALSPGQAERPPRKRAMRTTIAAPIVEMTI